jgi:hypothetical protein
MVRNMLRSVNSMNMGLLLFFFDCEVSFLIRSSAIWNTISVNPWMVVLTEVLCEDKENPEYKYIVQ